LYLADYHLHSSCSPDGHLPMEEIARLAVERGMDEICFTDHLDTIYWKDFSPCSEFDWPEALRQFQRAQERWGDRIKLKLGAEVGEVILSYERAQIQLDNAPELDFLIGSAHTTGAKFHYIDLYYMTREQESQYDAMLEDYLDGIRDLVLWGKFHVLGHLTLPLRILNEQLHMNMTFAPYMERVEEIFSIIIPKGIGIECNTNRGNTPLPDREILTLYRQMGGEIITLGSDAHHGRHVACAIKECQQLLKECGLRYFTTFHKGEPEFRPL